MRDALDQARLVDLVRNFGDDDGLAVFVESFDAGLGAHHEASAAVLVGIHDSARAVNDAGGGEIRALHEFQNFGELGIGTVHQRDGGIHDFGQIVGRNFRRHAHCDAVGSVDQQIRDARGKNVGLDFVAVVVRAHIDGIFVEIFEQRCSDAGQSGFGVTIGRGRIAIHRAEVSLSIHQRIAHGKRLRQAHQSVVHREVAVGMVFAHHVADDAGALAGGLVGRQAHLLHGVQNAAMHRLESVADVGQRAPDDHRHRIVEIRLLHLLFDIDGLNVERAGNAGAVSAAGRRSQGKFRILIVSHRKAFSS